jgi:thioredoxin-related protein
MDGRIVRSGLLVVLLTTTATWGTTAWARSIFSRKTAQTSQAPKAPPQAEPIQWLHDLKSAHRASVSSGRPMLIVFSGPKCFYCRKLENEVFTHPTVSRYINRGFVPVHLDLAKNREAAEILEVTSLPTTIILSSDADLLGSVEGFVDSRRFAETLHRSLAYQKSIREGEALQARGEK